MYIYESHMGGLFASENLLDDEETYCETCGDRDWLIGYAATRTEALKILLVYAGENDYGGYDYDYICEFVSGKWGK